MKWVIAEMVTEPGVFLEDDDGELVPYIHWVRHEDDAREFAVKQDAIDWIAQQSNRFLDDGSTERFELRRLADGFGAHRVELED